MKKAGLITLILLVGFIGVAQEPDKSKVKPFNWGATVGLSANLPVINSITVDDIELEDIHLKYKVGYQASVFARVNIDRFFLQPSVSWLHSESEILFSIPPLTETTAFAPSNIQTENQIEIRTRSLEMPIYIGYHIVQEAPYGLSFTVGPRIKYNYDVTYTINVDNSTHELVNEGSPWGVSIATGVGVNIWRMFFDFSYEFGLNRSESDFRDKSATIPMPVNYVTINKRTNVMSFSFGLLF
ncbi:porin family protein [Parabacteroides sp. PF5-9]|uniref:porin family protein n=1 Tax=Parabacteroides sp. PF5-9 TaxID=1742404 RepID=UPI0024750C30|nr:porin family protein [Parabacteroides sp. PF5-9]MDH6358745.1 hypothetical protein [Parabacteroides sp. PF5-9]